MSLDKLQEIFFSTVDMPSEEEAVKTIDFCLSVGIDINVRDKDSYTLLHRAAEKEKELIYKKLVESGANVNLQLDNGASVLGIAWKANDSFFKMAMDSGVDINLKGADDQTILVGLVARNLFSKSQMLIEKGADVNIPNRFGNTSLIYSEDLNITKMLLEKGANVNHQNSYKETGLIVAASKGKLEIVKMLLEAGADVNLMTIGGYTALTYAKQRGHKEIISLIENFIKKNKKFTPSVYKVDIGKNCTFEGSFVNESPDAGFINTPDGAKFPVKYVDGDFVFVSSYLSAVNTDGKFIFNL